MSIDTEGKTSVFDKKGKPDATTAVVKKRFLYEARNQGAHQAFRNIDQRNEARRASANRARETFQNGVVQNHTYGVSVSGLAMRAKGTQTREWKLEDGTKGLLTVKFLDGEVVDQTFEPYTQQ